MNFDDLLAEAKRQFPRRREELDELSNSPEVQPIRSRMTAKHYAGRAADRKELDSVEALYERPRAQAAKRAALAARDLIAKEAAAAEARTENMNATGGLLAVQTAYEHHKARVEKRLRKTADPRHEPFDGDLTLYSAQARGKVQWMPTEERVAGLNHYGNLHYRNAIHTNVPYIDGVTQAIERIRSENDTMMLAPVDRDTVTKFLRKSVAELAQLLAPLEINVRGLESDGNFSPDISHRSVADTAVVAGNADSVSTSAA